VKVTVLGAGDAFASRGYFQAAYIIETDGKRILMEAGPALLTAMKRAKFPPADLDLVLISHLHGDHFGGLPFLILEYMWESPRRTTLTIAGPRHLEHRTWAMFRSMYPRMERTQRENVARKLKFVVLEPRNIARLAGFKVSTIRTPHTRPDVSLGLRIDAGKKSIAFSGDTGWTEDLLLLSERSNLFLCECTYFESEHLDFHLNYPLIARERPRFKTDRFVLTHLGREVLDRKNEVRIEMAYDGMKIEL
jgi:ribonuclease BN (tRNA processing enzyme)